MSSRVLIFANPIAGMGTGLATAHEIAAALRSAGFAPEIITDRPPTAPIAPGTAHAAISIGGDGTLRSVVARLSGHTGLPPVLTDDPPASPAQLNFAPVLVVPTGTANLMRQSLGISADRHDLLPRVVSALTARNVAYRDLAIANGELFLIVAGAGLDGKIIHELEKRRKGPITLLDYTLPTLLSIQEWKYAPITVEVDGQIIFGPERGMAMVGSVKEHGIGFSFLQEAVPDDGLLDVLAFTCRSVFQGVDQLLNAAAGTLIGNEETVYVTGRRIRITSPDPVPVQADGEAAGFTPLDVEILPYKMPFILPG
jgi:diacylglycerol kinase (ATP)